MPSKRNYATDAHPRNGQRPDHGLCPAQDADNADKQPHEL